MTALKSENALSDEETARWTRVGMLAALAMVLGYLETFIPIPIPGVKLGLANIAVLIALARGDVEGALSIGAIKVLSTGFLFGNPITMAYSALGTLLAIAVMAPLSKLGGLSITLVSIAGALAHEAGQLLVAMVLLGTPLVWYSAPLLGIAGSVTGLLCGVIAKRALALAPEESTNGGDEAGFGGYANKSSLAEYERRGEPRVKPDARIVVAAFLIYAVIVIHLSSTPALIAALVIALAACIAGRVSARLLLRALRPTLAILAITLIAQIASNQQGEALFYIGPVSITSEGLLQTWIMTARLIALMGASVAVMHLTTPTSLIGALSWFLTPLRDRGLRTEGFALALNVALAAVPTVLSAFEQRSFDWRDWQSGIAQFIADQVH